VETFGESPVGGWFSLGGFHGGTIRHKPVCWLEKKGGVPLKREIIAMEFIIEKGGGQSTVHRCGATAFAEKDLCKYY